ncbi:MAG: diacylglycerol kinase [Gammaproteobacteria bacterium]
MPIALWLGKTGAQQALLIGCLLLVLIAELVNSATEAVVDGLARNITSFPGEQKILDERRC